MHSQCMRMIWTQLADHKIIVRKAHKDEPFMTLDGQERVLDDTMSGDL